MEDKLIVFDNLMEALKVFMISPRDESFSCLDGSTKERHRVRSGPSLAGKVFMVPQHMCGSPAFDRQVEQHQ